MNSKIEEIEKLRKAVIERHFPDHYALEVCRSSRPYEDPSLQMQIDEKVLFYIKLGITAEEVLESIKK